MIMPMTGLPVQSDSSECFQNAKHNLDASSRSSSSSKSCRSKHDTQSQFQCFLPVFVHPSRDRKPGR